jgi:two-component system, chemotaxis family, sensor kinase Cph1
MTNLISNAIKFTSGQDKAIIEVTGTEDGDRKIYMVRDNGVGFDMEYVDRLFGVFKRLYADAEFEGNGIGLANVHRIVHRHCGRVWAEGEVGVEAALFFTLPNAQRFVVGAVA